VEFSSNVVGEADIGHEVGGEKAPIIISPRLPGRGVWIDARTFVYTPRSGGLAQTTAYTVTVDKNLTDTDGNKLSGKRTFEMKTAPLAFKGARQVNFDGSSGFVTYALDFSAPVKTSRLNGFLTVEDAGGERAPFVIDGNMLSEQIRIRVEAQDGTPVTISVEKGMTADSGTLGLERKASFKVERDLSLAVQRAETASDTRGSYLEFETSAPLDIAKAASFISISGSKKISLQSAWGNVMRIRGSFGPRDRVTVKLRKGLPAANGETLPEDWERSFIVRDVEPQVELASQGRFLSPAGGRLLIPINTVNIEKLRVRVGRVYDNNVTVAMSGGWPYYPEGLAESVLDETYSVGGPLNETTKRAIDLRGAAAGRRGLFLIQATRAGYWEGVTHVINITDIAGSIRLGPSGALVWASSISSGKPMGGVDVTIWSSSNQPLASGKTNQEGVWLFEGNKKWPGHLQPDFVTLHSGGDTAVLRFDRNLRDDSELDLSGMPYAGNGYQAFCYTPRGVFRPGETVPVEVLLRDENLAIKQPFPVQIKIITPHGREWKIFTPMLSAMGMAAIQVEIPDAAPSGVWTADVRIPGDNASLGHARFSVEDFAPPRISVKAKATPKVFLSAGKGKLSVESAYLFGTPSDGLPYEAEMTIIPRKYSHKDWAGYDFSDNRREFETESISIGDGALSPEGGAEIDFEVRALRLPSMADIALRAGVMEEGGRWVYDTVRVPCYPSKVMLGIKRPAGAIRSGASYAFRVGAVNSKDGKPYTSLKEIGVAVYKVIRQPQIGSVNGSMSAEMREEFIPEREYKITFKNGVAELAVKFDSGGEYLVAVGDDKLDAVASQRFYVRDSSWSFESSEAALPGTLKVSLDKDGYKTGDTAKARVRGTFGGSVLLTVEADRVVHSSVKAASDGSAEFSFVVTEAMSPNAWVSAQLVRPAVAEEEWTPHRAIGVVPLSVDCAPKKLDVSVSHPASIKPAAKNDFTVQLRDASGKGVAGEVSLMLVDDGVLELTRFACPDPFRHFTSRRALGIRAYDIYDLLLPIDAGPPKTLKAGGGEAADMAAMTKGGGAFSPVRAERFKVLTLMDRVKTDSSGRAKFSFTVPEFAGRARLMVVAASSGAFGAYDKSFTIARDVVTEFSLPRAAAPGDVFTAQLQLFNKTAASREVTYNIEANALLTVKAPKGRVTLKPGDAGSAVIPVEIAVGKASGVARVTLTTGCAGTSSAQKIELPIRPPYPRVSKTGMFVVEPGKTQSVELPGGWMAGTRRGTITASGLPSVQIGDAARFLVDYPYHCLEQTVSSGWALLAQPGLVKQYDPALATTAQISAALSGRLRRIQALQKSDGSFASWPGGYAESGDSHFEWHSVYTAHFLTMCEAEGIALPGDMLRFAREYLRRLITIAPDARDETRFSAELSLRAYACYVLNLGKEAPPLSWMSYLKDNIASLSPSGRMMLAAAYARAGEKPTSRALLSDNAPSAKSYKPSEREGVNLDSNLRTLAIFLTAWNEIDPASAPAAAAARELLTALRATPRVTTQEASFALSSLGRYFSFNKEKGKAKFTASPAILRAAGDAEVASGVIPAGLNALKLTNGGDGRGFVSWSVDGVPLEAPTPEDVGVSVRLRLTDAEGKELKPDKPVVKGAKIIGTLTITPLGAPVSNLVVSMPLAGGLEIENPRLINPADDTEGSGRFIGVREEMRDDRLLLFHDNLRKPLLWSFTMRAVTPGVFALPPVSAEGMYSPGIRSVTESGKITVIQMKR